MNNNYSSSSICIKHLIQDIFKINCKALEECGRTLELVVVKLLHELESADIQTEILELLISVRIHY